MPRTPKVPGGRKNTACTVLSDPELADLDRLRGPLDRSSYLRWLIAYAKINKIRYQPKEET